YRLKSSSGRGDPASALGQGSVANRKSASVAVEGEGWRHQRNIVTGELPGPTPLSRSGDINGLLYAGERRLREAPGAKDYTMTRGPIPATPSGWISTRRRPRPVRPRAHPFSSSGRDHRARP